ncbi:MAG: class I SAM-dependent methyltransferase [Candidatus Omnitrophica bacterium]|nr:class I SAM-dependent methyltransferase [Candidatus Omnitrophota bacterium]
MGSLLSVISQLHKKTSRTYIDRMINDKAACMKVAKLFDKDFWDGDRKYGYGGYRYDGRQSEIARKFIEIYKLNNASKILDVGCGKGYLLYELKKILPGCAVTGFDISAYAIENAKEEIKKNLFLHPAQKRFPFKDKEFDLVISITTLHNLCIDELKFSLQEMERAGNNKYVAVESYRSEEELFNLQCWALTCQSFFSEREWVWLFREFGYSGDYEFIFFD